MEKLLEQKVAVITGAASGIGLEIARSFAKEGAKVMILDLNQEAAEAAAVQLRNQGYEAISMGCDVTHEDQVRSSIQRAVEAYGRLDILVNNAGLQHVSPIEDFPTAKFEQMLSIMLTAPFIAIKHAFPIMKQQGYGRVLNMASINGLIGFAGKAAYNSAKHGVIGLTKVAALEGAASGITVNAICPGYVNTPLVQNQMADLAKTRNVPLEKVLEEVLYPLVPQRRLLSVEEVANYAVFLASEKAQGVTGQAVVIDGGYTAQ
ncbi:3-hydroxybutyrate dehydrogenase [Brevibacillus invocatus]|uniref:3-hydroxybutyrate dehydrogenase n=1 Tax=Brevibacillus invocatus TaxID=173959 RepID=UPI002040EEB0|nr:3-hydroxybutyrate dehydrogenase [Brevibacillus invocatus]MCM3082114.1 3-hydroxybutyrate dehydrogenase [Brevibacillus invocatus]MCM3432535.1 3-hydroxybutyrate dehydrogenase [Brevibacillus invocatus]